jgi:GTP-binding protein EngB required for normal cell division
MDTEPRQRVPEITFRVLIIGRANAGKTSILQRVCETTESPFVYRKTGEGDEPVRGPTICL